MRSADHPWMHYWKSSGMDWREIGPYRESTIWVRALPNGAWMAAVAPLPTPADSRPAAGGPPDDQVLPEAFASDTAAVAAAMRHINREQERRVHREMTRGGRKGAGLTDASQEKRRFLRFPVALPVIAVAPHWPPNDLQGMVRNVGAGGLMAEFPLQMIQGSTVDLLLQTRRGLVNVAARIVWTAPSNGMVRHGCAFPVPKDESFAVGLFVGGSA